MTIATTETQNIKFFVDVPTNFETLDLEQSVNVTLYVQDDEEYREVASTTITKKDLSDNFTLVDFAKKTWGVDAIDITE